jgi:hypothetical protein
VGGLFPPPAKRAGRQLTLEVPGFVASVSGFSQFTMQERHIDILYFAVPFKMFARLFPIKILVNSLVFGKYFLLIAYIKEITL